MAITFCGPAWPCLLGMFALAALGVAPVGTILATGIGSDSVMLMIFFFIFVAVLEQNKITEFLATWMITRKIVKGLPLIIFLYYDYRHHVYRCSGFQFSGYDCILGHFDFSLQAI